MIYDASYDIFDFKTIGCIIRMCELYEYKATAVMHKRLLQWH